MFDTLAVLGTGLLGCSVLRAARERGLARRFHAWNVRPAGSRRCADEGWADAAFEFVGDAVADADLVVISTPADTLVSIAEQIAPRLKPGAIVTDVASTKGHGVRLAHAAMPAGRHFVGAHPMAGSEKNGPDASRVDLFEGRACFVTPLEGRTDAEALRRVERFWADIGCRVVTKDADEHDEIVAHISHLPHALAVVLALTLDEKPSDWRECAGGGLRDTSRVAGGSPEIWRAIFMENRHEVVRALDSAENKLHELRKMIAEGDEAALRGALTRAREWRAGLRSE